MGDRAVITTKDKEIGVYLHWCGNPENVQAFLDVCNDCGFRKPEEDEYGFARLCQVIGNYFSDGLSVGIGLFKHTDYDNINNGYYIIKDWRIVAQVKGERKIKNPHIDRQSHEYMRIYFMCKEQMTRIMSEN